MEIWPTQVYPIEIRPTQLYIHRALAPKMLIKLPPVACNRTAHIRHLCRKTTVLSSHRCHINTGVEKNNNRLEL